MQPVSLVDSDLANSRSLFEPDVACSYLTWVSSWIFLREHPCIPPSTNDMSESLSCKPNTISFRDLVLSEKKKKRYIYQTDRSSTSAYLWAVCFTVHSLNSSSEVSTTMSMLVRGVWPCPSAVACSRRSTYKIIATQQERKFTVSCIQWQHKDFNWFKGKNTGPMIITHSCVNLLTNFD